MSAIIFVAGKMCLTKLFQNLSIYQDKKVRESEFSSFFRLASFTELMFIVRKWVKPSISCRVILCTLPRRDCEALTLRVDARLFRNAKEDFRNTPSLSKVCF